MKVALFGGSFNPPHVAHVLAAAYVLSTEEVDEVLVVPCFLHPLGKVLAPYEDRFEMTRLAMSWLPRTVVSRVELELGGPSRTLRTLEHLLSARPGDSFRLVMGADLVLDGKNWHGFGRLMELAPPIVLGRAGVEAPGAPAVVLPEISSSAIRRSLAEGRAERVRALLPRGVGSYIEAHGLYTRGDG